MSLVLQVVLYFASCVLLLAILFAALRRSEFGVLLAGSEYFYLIGLTVVPLLFVMGGLADPVANSFFNASGIPGIGTSVHIFLYSVGAAGGYFAAGGAKRRLGVRTLHVAVELRVNHRHAFLLLVLTAIVFYSIFFSNVGFLDAIAATEAMRAGSFESLQSGTQFVFLRRLALLGTLAVCFLPALMVQHQLLGWRLLIYAVMVALVFVNTAARVTVLELVIVPLGIYVYLQRSVAVTVGAALAAGILVPLVVLYGKHFTGYLAAVLQGQDAELLAFGFAESMLQKALTNFNVLWFSVAAGIEHWWSNGPLVPEDVALSFLGVVPSSVFETLGVAGLSYHNATERLPCINSAAFGIDNCSIPPYLPGYAAYVLPFGGALVAGFVRYWIFSVLEATWAAAKQSDYALTWYPYVLFIVAWNILLVVPSTIAFGTFVVVLLGALILIKRMTQRKHGGGK